ncbi:MAG: hypothetical protein HYR91_04640 [Flavobacteriia bacterium]|nr:hypothetical protein [Flavobacteriia bacterium]
MIKLFLGNRSVVLFLLPFVIALYVLINYFKNYYQYSTLSNFGFWGNKTLPDNLIVIQAITSFFIVVNAVGINAIFNWNEFLGRNSFMPSLLYVLLMSYYHSFYKVDGLLISHSFLILMIYQLFKLRQNEEGRRLVFNAAFFSGIAATFHPPLIGFFPFIFIMIWTIRPIIIREILLTIIGLSIPLIYAGLYLLYTQTSIDLKLLKIPSNYDRHKFDFLISTSIFILSFLLSLISIQSNLKKSSIRLKKLVQILWWIIITGIVLGIMDYILFKQIERFSLLMIPLSFLLTYSFTHKTWFHVANGLFYITLIYSFVKFFF